MDRITDPSDAASSSSAVEGQSDGVATKLAAWQAGVPELSHSQRQGMLVGYLDSLHSLAPVQQAINGLTAKPEAKADFEPPGLPPSADAGSSFEDSVARGTPAAVRAFLKGLMSDASAELEALRASSTAGLTLDVLSRSAPGEAPSCNMLRSIMLALLDVDALSYAVMPRRSLLRTGF